MREYGRSTFLRQSLPFELQRLAAIGHSKEHVERGVQRWALKQGWRRALPRSTSFVVDVRIPRINAVQQKEIHFMLPHLVRGTRARCVQSEGVTYVVVVCGRSFAAARNACDVSAPR